jgi:hypothetical protein
MALTQITTNGIKDGTIASADLSDQSVTLAKLPHGTSSNDGKFLRANNGADPTFESVVTDLVNDTSPQLGGDLSSNSRSINFGDSSGGGVNRAQFGDSNDLKMFHSTSGDSLITNSTGELLIQSNGNIILEKVGSTEKYFKAIPDGAVELYHNNVKKFETDANGCTVTGNLNASNVDLGDNAKLRLGTGQDLNIYHDGTNSHVQNGTGTLRIRGDLIKLNDNAASENYLVATANGSVTLCYAGSTKLETTSTGATLTGDLYVTNDVLIPSSGEFFGYDNSKLVLGHGRDLQIYHDGTDDVIHSTGTSLRTRSNIFRANNAANNAVMFRATTGGNFEAYYDGGKKFETQADGIYVTGKIQPTGHIYQNDNLKHYWGNSQDLQIYHSGSENHIKGTGSHTLIFSTNNSERWGIESGGHFKPHANNSYDIGTSTYRVRNIYTNDLNLSNEGGSNDVDGTWGSYTIQEGAEDLFLVNKRNGKKYKFALTEVS